MTVGEWLRARTPEAPDRLRARVDAVLGPRRDEDAAATPDMCLDAACGLLDDLLGRPSAGRESALDLLTVDALVTYAFEAASDQPADLGDRAVTAMRRLGATVRE